MLILFPLIVSRAFVQHLLSQRQPGKYPSPALPFSSAFGMTEFSSKLPWWPTGSSLRLVLSERGRTSQGLWTRHPERILFVNSTYSQQPDLLLASSIRRSSSYPSCHPSQSREIHLLDPRIRIPYHSMSDPRTSWLTGRDRMTRLIRKSKFIARTWCLPV
jgi:hypothetical protein